MECWKSRLLPSCRVVTLPAAKARDQHREQVPSERLLQFRTQTVSRLEGTMKPIATLSALGGIVACCLLLAGVVAGPAQSKSPGSEGTWLTKAELLTPRYDVGVAALNSKIYVLGG